MGPAAGLNPPAAEVVAVDVGGTTIKAARVAPDGVVGPELVVTTPVEQGPDAVLGAVADVVERLRTARTAAAGVLVPGIVDAAAGLVRYAPNLGLVEVPLAREVSGLTGLPVAMEHDVRGACLAELVLGTGRTVGDFTLVVLGTGIAAGLVTDGRVLRGADGGAGELGHLPVVWDGERCRCGQRGCLEVYASAAGLLRRYRQAGGAPADGAQDVLARLGRDEVADAVWAQAVQALGRALSSVVLLLEPATVVLAGGLSGAGTVLTEAVQESLGDLLAWRRPPQVVISALGARAGLHGAALVAARAAGEPGRERPAG